MQRIGKKWLAGAAALALSAMSANGAIISQWTFESISTVPPVGTSAGPYAAEVANVAGTTAMSTVHAASATYSTPAGNGSAKSFSANTWSQGDYIQFQSPTTGNTGIQVLVDHTSSGTGPTTFKLAYSTDGTTFTDLPTGAYTINTGQSFSSVTEKTTTPPRYLFDLSSVAELDNQAAVYFRLIDTFATGATGGTSRVDNFVVGTSLPVPPPLPEPSMLGLAGLAMGVLVRRRRK